MLLSLALIILAVFPQDLIEVTRISDELECRLILATPKNPVGLPLYGLKSCCIVSVECYSNLISAALEAKSLGYTLCVIDALRPLYVQEALFSVINNPKYVSKPGGDDDLHSRGLAIDLLLLDPTGLPLRMPSEYLEAGATSHADFQDIDAKALFNRELLAGIMVKNGFKRHPYRWWEFQSTYWDTLSTEQKELFPPFNLPIEEALLHGTCN